VPHPFYFSGSCINGVVVLELREIFYSDRIRIEFKGAEKCYFDTGDFGYHSGVGDIKGKNILKHDVYILKNFPEGRIYPGTYEFPFSIDLPYQLPSTLIYAGIQRCLMKITYRLRAGLEDVSN